MEAFRAYFVKRAGLSGCMVGEKPAPRGQRTMHKMERIALATPIQRAFLAARGFRLVWNGEIRSKEEAGCVLRLPTLPCLTTCFAVNRIVWLRAGHCLMMLFPNASVSRPSRTAP